MSYEFADFHNKLPQKRDCITLDPDTECALHAARWPYGAFDGLADFLRFHYRYSCVLQPYIYDPDRDDLEGWFGADPNADERAAALLRRQPPVNQEAREWMKHHYPTISIDWLNAGLHGKLISLTDGDRPEMVGYDTEGYFCVFAADAT